MLQSHQPNLTLVFHYYHPSLFSLLTFQVHEGQGWTHMNTHSRRPTGLDLYGNTRDAQLMELFQCCLQISRQWPLTPQLTNKYWNTFMKQYRYRHRYMRTKQKCQYMLARVLAEFQYKRAVSCSQCRNNPRCPQISIHSLNCDIAFSSCFIFRTKSAHEQPQQLNLR